MQRIGAVFSPFTFISFIKSFNGLYEPPLSV